MRLSPLLELPHLYILVVILKDTAGHIVDCESCQVGIRQISKAHKQLLVNGQPVMIRGVNRHEHHPRLGKTNLESCMVKVKVTNVFVEEEIEYNVRLLVDIIKEVVSNGALRDWDVKITSCRAPYYDLKLLLIGVFNYQICNWGVGSVYCRD